MQQEIEVKFLGVDHDEVREKLKVLGATCEQPMRLMRRAIIDYHDRRLQTAAGKWGWIRVRDEGDKVTLTYKQIADDERQTTHEIEVIVSDFDKTVELFKTIGLNVESFQESKRETWKYKNSEVVLDEWPWVDPFFEIEGPSEAELKQIVAELGYKWEDAMYGSATGAYKRQYPKITDQESIGNVPEVRFGLPVPQWLKDRL